MKNWSQQSYNAIKNILVSYARFLINRLYSCLPDTIHAQTKRNTETHRSGAGNI